MALALSDFTTRIGNELRLLGTPTAARTDLIKDALIELMTAIRSAVRISASLAVTIAASTYDIPGTIDKIETIEDEDGDGVVYTIDRLEREITFQDTASGSVNYTVYGTPYAIRTNASTVIAALPESYSVALWAWVVAVCHGQAESEKHTEKVKLADRACHKLLMYLNSEPGYLDRTIVIRDATGRRVGVTDAVDGINYDITDLGASLGYDPV